MLTWLLVAVAALLATGLVTDSLRCPQRHWVWGRCSRRTRHRGNHLAGDHAWSTRGFLRRLDS